MKYETWNVSTKTFYVFVPFSIKFCYRLNVAFKIIKKEKCILINFSIIERPQFQPTAANLFVSFINLSYH